MKNKVKLLLSLALILSMAVNFTACGDGSSEEEPTSSQVEINTDTNTSEDPVTPDPSKIDVEEGNDMTTDALSAANAAEKGSIDILSGKYAVEGASQTYYIFNGENCYCLKEGTYEPQGDKIILQYGSDKGWDYEVTAGSKDRQYNLQRGTQLIPLTFKDGFDGITGKKLFGGVYQFGDSKTADWIFAKDGTMCEVNTLDTKVEDSTLSIAGTKYSWETSDGKILVKSNDSTVMTLVPVV